MVLRVLIPLDGSQRSFAAMERGLRLLGGIQKEVTLLCVMHEGFAKVDQERVQAFDEDEHDEVFPNQNSCDRMLDAAESHCKDLGESCHRKVVEGKVLPLIMEESADHDLILLHALDKRGLLEKLRMSGTERIARQAACSVLLVEDE